VPSRLLPIKRLQEKDRRRPIPVKRRPRGKKIGIPKLQKEGAAGSQEKVRGINDGGIDELPLRK